MKKQIVALLLLALVGGAQLALAQTMTDVGNVARAGFRTEKSAIMAKAMGLTESQSKAFWPLYRAYETESDKLLDQRISLLRSFADHYDAMTDKKASELAREAFKLDRGRAALLEKTYKKMGKELSPLIAVRFAQVERQIGTLMDLEIMRSVPLIASPAELGIPSPK